MAEYIYIDNSNIFIEGKKIAAKKGRSKRTSDKNCRLDFGELYDFVAESDPTKIARALLLGSSPPDSDKVWTTAEKVGFEVVVIERNVENREKKVDRGIVAAMIKDAYARVSRNNDTISLVAGDSDYVPAVRMLVKDGFHVEVVFWSSVSRELKDEASRFIQLDKHLETLKYD